MSDLRSQINSLTVAEKAELLDTVLGKPGSGLRIADGGATSGA
jgi:hypothetical protein